MICMQMESTPTPLSILRTWMCCETKSSLKGEGNDVEDKSSHEPDARQSHRLKEWLPWTSIGSAGWAYADKPAVLLESCLLDVVARLDRSLAVGKLGNLESSAIGMAYAHTLHLPVGVIFDSDENNGSIVTMFLLAGCRRLGHRLGH